MRIAMIGQKGLPTKYGGIERHVEELSAQLVNLGCEVLAYTRPSYTDPKLKSWRGIELISLPSIHTKHLDAISHTFLALCHAMWVAKDIDIIHLHGVGPAILSWMPRLFSPAKKVVVTFHSPDRLHGKWGLFAKWCLTFGEWAAVNWPHETVVVSRALQNYALHQHQAKTLYLPNGVRLEGVVGESTFSPAELAATFNLNSRGYFLVVSRLVSHKRIEDVIQAWKQIQTKLPLVIVGDSVQTDDYVQFLKALSAYENKIHFLGFQQGVALQSLIAHAKCFISASSNEGLPISVLEAMAIGVPVILSDIPEHQEIVHGGNGLLFSAGNSTALAELMKTVLQPENQAWLQAMALKAMKRIQTEYSWPDIARGIHRVYRHVLTLDGQGKMWPGLKFAARQ